MRLEHWLYTLPLRIRSIFRRRQVEQELQEELQFHLEQRIEEEIAEGTAPEQVRYSALRAMDGLEQHKEECRDMRGVNLIDNLLQDLRFGVRMLRKSPIFTLIAILTLTLGIGAVSTAFAVVNALFLRRLPVNHSGEIVSVEAIRGNGETTAPVSYPDYVHFRDNSQTIKELAAHYSTAPLFVTIADQSKEVNGAVVTANFFDVLRVRPALGRFFREDEDRVPDRDRVAVVSHDFWQNWLGSSPESLGSTVKINGIAFTVIGVAPRELPSLAVTPAGIYIPTMMLRVGYRWCDDSLAENCTMLDMIGRLAGGHTVSEANAEMTTLLPIQWKLTRDPDSNTGVKVFRPLGEDRSQSEVQLVTLLGWVSGTILLVCCANLAGLLVVRASARGRELAIRTSIGATRTRLIRQLLTESVLLSSIGAFLGVFFSLALTPALRAMFYSVDSEGHFLQFNFSPDTGVIVTSIAISLICGILFGSISALKSSHEAIAENLKRQSSNATKLSRLTNWLVGMQAAMAVALVAIASLLVGSARMIVNGTNFDSSHVALMRLRPRLLKYPPVKAQQFQRTVINRLRAMPGVESVSVVGTGAVLRGSSAMVSLPNRTEADRQGIDSGYIEVGPGYFETLRTPLLQGREFDNRDTLTSPPVAIVNQTLARRLWPRDAVISSVVMIERQPYRIIGIVKDIPLENRMEPRQLYVYVDYWQKPQEIDARYCMRVKGDPNTMLPRLAREVNRIDPSVPVAETITLSLQLEGQFRPLRVSATFLAYAAALAVLLSAIGVYAMLAFSVSRRSKEIGIRMALGGKSTQVLAMIAREGTTVVAAGALSGLVLAFICTRLVRHFLYGSGDWDAAFYCAAALLVIVVGLIASWFPARHAASIEPLVALRED